MKFFTRISSGTKLLLAVLLGVLILALFLYYFLNPSKTKKESVLKTTTAVTIQLSDKWTQEQVKDALKEYQETPITQPLTPESQKIIDEIDAQQKQKMEEISKTEPWRTDAIISLQNPQGGLFNNLRPDNTNLKTNLNFFSSAYAQEDPCPKAGVASVNENFEFACNVPDNVRNMLNESYPKIENIYGPKFADRVTGEKGAKIKVKIDSFNYYNCSTNTIGLSEDYQKDNFVLTHELVHAFHGPAASYIDNSWGEGMAEAITWLLSTDEQRNNNILNTYRPDGSVIGWGQAFPGSRTSKGFYEAEPLALPFRDFYDYYIWYSMANVKFYYLYGQSFFKNLNTSLFLALKNAPNTGYVDNDYTINTIEMMQKVANMIPTIEGYPTLQWFGVKLFGVFDFSATNSILSAYVAPDNGYSILANGTGLVLYSNDLETIDNLTVFDDKNQILGVTQTELKNETIFFENSFISEDKLDYYHSYKGLIKIVLSSKEKVFEEFLPKTDDILENGKLKKVIYGLAIGATDGGVARINNDTAIIKNGMYVISSPAAAEAGLFNVEVSPVAPLISGENVTNSGKFDYQFYKVKIDSYTTVVDLRRLDCCPKVDIAQKTVQDACKQCGKIISFDGMPLYRIWGNTDLTEGYEVYVDNLWDLSSKIDLSVTPINTSGWTLDNNKYDIIKEVIKN